MHSSYITNNYGEVFKAMITAFLPVNCVELGVLEGYSAIAIAEGLKDNFEKRGTKGHLNAFDLFDKYPYRHASQKTVEKNIEEKGLTEWVTLHEADAFLVDGKYEDHSVHFLHIDLSNTGATVKKIMEDWDKKMAVGGIVCFEGGSEERDQIEWMKKYNAQSIKQELETNPIIEENYVFGTYFKFPGLTCLLKKR